MGRARQPRQSRRGSRASPPWDSLRSGSSKKATSPCAAWRSSTCLGKTGIQFICVRLPVLQGLLLEGLDHGAVSSDRAGVEEPEQRPHVARGDRSTSSGRRTEWSSLMPSSHTGYQTASAMASTLTRRLWTRTTSRSLKGNSSPRPYPPTAIRAMPAFSAPPACSSNPVIHVSAAADNAAQKASPWSSVRSMSSWRMARSDGGGTADGTTRPRDRPMTVGWWWSGGVTRKDSAQRLPWRWDLRHVESPGPGGCHE